MKPETPLLIQAAIIDRIGIQVNFRVFEDRFGNYIDFIPVDAHPNESFVIRYRKGWHSADVSFIPGQFAAHLIYHMGKCDIEHRALFKSFLSSAFSNGIKCDLKINSIPIELEALDLWPENWSNLELILKKNNIIFASEPASWILNEPEGSNYDSSPKLTMTEDKVGIDLVLPMFGMMATLIGVEESGPITIGEAEGKAIQYLSTRFERKKINREACIQLKGLRCIVCGFDFMNTYGVLGIGYIEIHHQEPLSSIGEEHVINVEQDLFPLCSNCHSMVHRNNPPLLVGELQKIITERRR